MYAGPSLLQVVNVKTTSTRVSSMTIATATTAHLSCSLIRPVLNLKLYMGGRQGKLYCKLFVLITCACCLATVVRI